MTKLPFFNPVCPGCSKTNQLTIQYLGHDVNCCHCKRKFVARDRDAESAALEDPLNFWIRFTDLQKPEFENPSDKDIARTPR